MDLGSAQSALGAPSAPSAPGAVAGHFRALLESLALRQEAFAPDAFEATWQRLQLSLLSWSDERSPSSCLAARSCEALVRTLRLLDDSDLPWVSRALCYIGCFQSLAAALRAFGSSCDLLVPGQGVTLVGLQTAVGEQLNGARGIVQLFDAPTGRFAVCLKEGDPPGDWKRIRPQNLQAHVDPTSAASVALQGARECGRSCLESVADIFDDLLLTIHRENGDDLVIVHAHLSASMWEVLIECLGDASLGASALLDLCGNATVCSVLARHMFSVPATSGPLPHVTRLLRLQESFGRAYCKLYQSDAFWDGSADNAERGIADLQGDLEGHLLHLAGAALPLDGLESFLHCCKQHVAWAASSGQAHHCPAPVLAILFFRLVCTLALASKNATICPAELVQRHLIMLTPAILSLADVFTELLIARLHEAPKSANFLLAARAALDAALVLLGLWVSGCRRHHDHLATVEVVACRLLECQDVHPALLARLALGLLSSPTSCKAKGAQAEVASRLAQLPLEDQAIFWQQASARSCLLFASPALVRQQLQDAGFGSPRPVEVQLLEDCVEQPWPSLADADSAAAAEESLPVLQELLQLEALWRNPETSLQMDAALPTAAAFPPASGESDALPQAAPSPKDLGRSGIARLRGVDQRDAPEELRCSIDGKLMVDPVHSPYGHLFERETLQRWLSTCGSVCPITGNPLKEEDCDSAAETQQRVLDWVEAARSSYKQRLEEKRRRRLRKEVQAADKLGQGVA